MGLIIKRLSHWVLKDAVGGRGFVVLSIGLKLVDKKVTDQTHWLDHKVSINWRFDGLLALVLARWRRLG